MRGIAKWVVVAVSTLIVLVGAGWLAVHRADIPYATLEDRYQLGSSDYVRLPNGLLVHYTDEGPSDGPVMLMVHGLASSLETWTAWKEEFLHDYRVIRVDLPGHGLTRVLGTTDLTTSGLVDFLDRFATQLDLEKFTLVGVSLGGHLGWEYALRFPDRLHALVMVAPAGAMIEASSYLETTDGQSWIGNDMVRRFLATLDPAPAIRSGLEAAFSTPDMVSSELVEQYSELARAPGHRSALLQIAARPDRAHEDALSRVRGVSVPVFVLHGDLDAVIPVTHGQQIAAAIEGARFSVMTGVGHLPQEERPSESADRVLDFLLSLQTETPPPDATGFDVPSADE